MSESTVCNGRYMDDGGCCSPTRPRKTKMIMKKQPTEDVTPIKNGDFPASHVSLLQVQRF